MHVCRIRFSLPESLPPDTARDLLDCYLAALRMNGQILGREWPIFRKGKHLETLVMSPDDDSLAAAHTGKYPSQCLQETRAKDIHVSCEAVAEEACSSPNCTCDNPSGYLLFTTYLQIASPVRCLDCERPIPLYKLPYVSDHSHYEIICWQSDYQACDSLQMNCSVLERASTRQLADPNTALSRSGRNICDALTEKLNKPVYYYLYREKGRSLKSERARRCPVCGSDWLLPEPLHGFFDFKCDHCRLLSNVAFVK